MGFGFHFTEHKTVSALSESDANRKLEACTGHWKRGHFRAVVLPCLYTAVYYQLPTNLSWAKLIATLDYLPRKLKPCKVSSGLAGGPVLQSGHQLRGSRGVQSCFYSSNWCFANSFLPSFLSFPFCPSAVALATHHQNPCRVLCMGRRVANARHPFLAALSFPGFRRQMFFLRLARAKGFFQALRPRPRAGVWRLRLRPPLSNPALPSVPRRVCTCSGRRQGRGASAPQPCTTRQRAPFLPLPSTALRLASAEQPEASDWLRTVVPWGRCGRRPRDRFMAAPPPPSHRPVGMMSPVLTPFIPRSPKPGSLTARPPTPKFKSSILQMTTQSCQYPLLKRKKEGEKNPTQ